VHRNARGDLAVVGVLMRAAPAGRAAVRQVLEAAPRDKGSAETEATINPLSLLPVKAHSVAATRQRVRIDSYHTYAGSLTTPPCSEGVRWFVLRDVLPVPQAAVDALRERVGAFDVQRGHAANARPVQPLDGRTVARAAR
jgi:carbonic anhydrase